MVRSVADGWFNWVRGVFATAILLALSSTTCWAQSNPADSSPQAQPAADAAKPAGQRVFYASHSLMWDMPPVLAEMAKAYGIQGHSIVGHQRIGVSRTMQHWNLPDDQNQAKQALREGNVDVFVTSTLVHPDEGITNFAKLGLEHNPNMKLLMQVNWTGFNYTDNDQFNQGGGFGGGFGGGRGRRGSDRGGADQGDTAQEGDAREGAAQDAGGQGRGRRGGFGRGRRGGFGRGGMYLSGNDDKTPEELAKINLIDIKNAEEQAKMLNQEYGKDRTFAFLVPTSQAHNALRTLIYKKEVPGMASQSEMFRDPIGHPTAPVIALNAYLHFAVLYQRSPVGLPMPSILMNASRPEWRSEELNRKLQELAWDVVSKYPPSGVPQSLIQ